MAAGLRSLLAFWLGGAANSPTDPGPPPTPPSATEQGVVLGTATTVMVDSTTYTVLGIGDY